MPINSRKTNRVAKWSFYKLKLGNSPIPKLLQIYLANKSFISNKALLSKQKITVHLIVQVSLPRRIRFVCPSGFPRYKRQRIYQGMKFIEYGPDVPFLDPHFIACPKVRPLGDGGWSPRVPCSNQLFAAEKGWQNLREKEKDRNEIQCLFRFG